MAIRSIKDDRARSMTISGALTALEAVPDGLQDSEAKNRQMTFGFNSLEEKKTSQLRVLFGFFWGPIPWMIEIACLLSAIVGHWADFFVILVLLIFNALIGFYQEHKASNALEALKEQLALKARCLRNGKWQDILAKELVPGDVVQIKLGDIIPADVKIIEGDYLSVDQAALTGESLPVNKRLSDVVYSGSVAKQGQVKGLVYATGGKTFFGRTAKLVEEAGQPSHFQKAVLTIGDYLIYLTLALVGVLILVGLERSLPIMELVQFGLILTVAAIPVAMPAVLSVTMAVGALKLSKMKAIVSRLESIEEMAGMDVLCSDKTGTLTQNRLTMGQVVALGKATEQELVFTACLACQQDGKDPIDQAILDSLKEKSALKDYKIQKFTPFDPVSKRTMALLKDPSGQDFWVSKGAPQVIFDLCGECKLREKALLIVDELAEKGYRTIAVAQKQDSDQWSFLGILPLFDPPRDDAQRTISEAKKHGIGVKMITGDHEAIAKQTAKQLGLGTDIKPANQLLGDDQQTKILDIGKEVEEADGFAQVFPEHKYNIVKTLQKKGHLVAMTGDGVNDAPALKQADVGIAVSGATDAARLAADLVLTAPGLGVIVKAVEEARRIFERMNSYAIYRITETIRIMIFVVLAMLVYNFYPITAIMIILLALLNDIPIMTIATDKTWLSKNPVRWNMRKVLTVSSVLGAIGVVETFGLLILAKSWLGLSIAEVQSFIFLKLAVAGHLTLFVARTNKSMWKWPYPAKAMIWSALLTKLLATLVVGLGLFVTPITWEQIGLVWGYCLIWMQIEDLVKLAVYRHMDFKHKRHRAFLEKMTRVLGRKYS